MFVSLSFCIVKYAQMLWHFQYYVLNSDNDILHKNHTETYNTTSDLVHSTLSSSQSVSVLFELV